MLDSVLSLKGRINTLRMVVRTSGYDFDLSELDLFIKELGDNNTRIATDSEIKKCSSLIEKTIKSCV